MCVILFTTRAIAEALPQSGHREIKMMLRYAYPAPSHLDAGIQALEERQQTPRMDTRLCTDLCATTVSQEISGRA